jgi:hypothetical protein
MMTVQESEAYHSMKTPSQAKTYLGVLVDDHSRKDHIRDYLKFALTIVNDEQGPILVWVPSTGNANKVEEETFFDRYEGHKIHFTATRILKNNVSLYSRIVFAWLRGEPTKAAYPHVFKHPNRYVRQLLTKRNSKKLKQNATWRMGEGPSMNNQVHNSNTMKTTNTVQTPDNVNTLTTKKNTTTVQTPDIDAHKVALCDILKQWNDALRLDNGMKIPTAMLMFTVDIDCIVSHRYVHLLTALLQHAYDGDHVNELDRFVSKVTLQPSYREMYKMVQRLVSPALEKHIAKRRRELSYEGTRT